MANTSAAPCTKDLKFYERIRHFPPIIDGRINAIQFLEASRDVVLFIDRLGKQFSLVKYDIQRNIDKITTHCTFDENSCLLEEILHGRNKIVVESVVWLNRALMFLELVFEQWLDCFRNENLNVSTSKLFSVAYEGSVKKYHNWITRKIFAFICEISPTIPEILKAIDGDKDIIAFESVIFTYNTKLHLVRCKIEDFVKENKLFEYE